MMQPAMVVRSRVMRICLLMAGVIVFTGCGGPPSRDVAGRMIEEAHFRNLSYEYYEISVGEAIELGQSAPVYYALADSGIVTVKKVPDVLRRGREMYQVQFAPKYKDKQGGRSVIFKESHSYDTYVWDSIQDGHFTPAHNLTVKTDVYRVPLCRPEFDRVTGISVYDGKVSAKAQFTWKYGGETEMYTIIKPYIDTRSFEKIGAGVAEFRKYDDGWRLVECWWQRYPS